MAGPLVIVLDGCGGTPPGIVAELALQAALVHVDPQTALVAAGRAIHSSDVEDEWEGGATAVAARFDASGAAIAHVGDCRASLWRHGALRAITRDHSVINVLIAEGKMTELEAETSPHRHVLARALGLQADVDVEVGRVELERGDRLILTTDGAHGVGIDLAALLTESEPERVVAAIVAEARQRGRDNVTVVVADVG